MSKRIINCYVDGLLILFSFVFIFVFNIFDDLLDSIFLGKNNIPYFSLILSMFGYCFLYYFVFESIFQQTPAKFITKTKVVDKDGNKPKLIQIAKRSLARFFPIPLTKEFPDSGLFFHDKWSNTKVIEINE